MDKLSQSVKNFAALEKIITDGSHQLYHKVVASMHELCFSILDAEKNGKSKADIDEIIKPARDIHSRSVFVKRLQEWPRKYPGDFETVEYICDLENKSIYEYDLLLLRTPLSQNQIGWQSLEKFH